MLISWKAWKLNNRVHVNISVIGAVISLTKSLYIYVCIWNLITTIFAIISICFDCNILREIAEDIWKCH